jgi:DNA-binding MltR family transcriptional regulator
MAEEGSELVERVARALFEHALAKAREELDQRDLGLEDSRDFFLRLRGESDAALVVLGTSYIDTKITEAWKRNLRGKSNAALDALFENTGPLSTMSAKIRLAHGLDWITDNLAIDLHTVRKIRNEFAHDPYKHRLEDPGSQKLINSMAATEKEAIKVIRGMAEIPDPTLRSIFHVRLCIICHSVVTQMAIGPIAMKHQVPKGSLLGDGFDDASKARKELMMMQARTVMNILGGQPDPIPQSMG